MSDLFSEVDPHSAATDPRKQRMVEAPEVPQGPPRMRDATHMQTVIREVVMEEAPSAADIAVYRGKGWNEPGCHRWRFEDYEIPVAGILSPPKTGAISEPQFRWMIKSKMEKSNLGTFLAVLLREQGNGLWLPCEVATTTRMVPKLDLIRKARFVSPEAGIDEWDEYPTTEAVPVATEVVAVRIRWVDAKNAQAIEYDAQGQPITGPRISVNAGMSPEVAATLERIASRGEGGTAEALMAVVAEMRAQREASTAQAVPAKVEPVVDLPPDPGPVTPSRGPAASWPKPGDKR